MSEWDEMETLLRQERLLHRKYVIQETALVLHDCYRCAKCGTAPCVCDVSEELE